MRGLARLDAQRWVAASILAVATMLLLSGTAGAQDERARSKTSVAPTPIPPSRPTNLTAVPDAPRAALAPPVQAPPRKAVATLAEPPHDLPVATRARMHECGAEWQRMKMSGDAADKIWRVFAQACLVSQTP